LRQGQRSQGSGRWPDWTQADASERPRCRVGWIVPSRSPPPTMQDNDVGFVPTLHTCHSPL